MNNEEEFFHSIKSWLNGKFKIIGTAGINVAWTVNGKRGNVDIEPLNIDIIEKGDGPYKWITKKY